jgi:hypothetical protein
VKAARRIERLRVLASVSLSAALQPMPFINGTIRPVLIERLQPAVGRLLDCPAARGRIRAKHAGQLTEASVENLFEPSMALESREL